MERAMVVLAFALAGCAGTRSVQSVDPLPGHSVGVIDRDGRQRPLSVMIDGEATGP